MTKRRRRPQWIAASLRAAADAYAWRMRELGGTDRQITAHVIAEWIRAVPWPTTMLADMARVTDEIERAAIPEHQRAAWQRERERGT